MLTDLIMDALWERLPGRLQAALLGLLALVLAGGFAVWWFMG